MSTKAVALGTIRNPYMKFAKISAEQMRDVMNAFAQDLTASDAARRTRLSVRTVNTLYLRLRRRIASNAAAQTVLPLPAPLQQYADMRLRKLKGVRKSMLSLHLTETAWRFHRPAGVLYEHLLNELQLHPL